MTQPVQETTTDRQVSGLDYRTRQLARRPSLSAGGGGPPIFRALIQGTEDSEANRTHYPSGDGGDNVYWDAWDPTFDTSIFDITNYDFTDPNTGRPSIAGVGLKLPGLYSILSQVDIWGYLNGVVDMRSGWDEGQANYWEVANIPNSGEPFLQDQQVYRVDHWRHVEHEGGIEDDNAIIMPVAWDVEIIFAQNNDDDVVPFGGVSPGSDSTFPYTPVPGSDVWIPGGTWNAGWGLIPFLLIAYWGIPPSGFDPDWTGTLELDGTD